MNCLSESRPPAFCLLTLLLVDAIVLASAKSASADDIMVTKAPAIPYSNAAAYDWSGFYAGVHMGVAWGSSNWTEQPEGLAGSINLFQRPDAFSEFGSWFGGIQAHSVISRQRSISVAFEGEADTRDIAALVNNDENDPEGDIPRGRRLKPLCAVSNSPHRRKVLRFGKACS
jgi:hypothetical protein